MLKCAFSTKPYFLLDFLQNKLTPFSKSAFPPHPRKTGSLKRQGRAGKRVAKDFSWSAFVLLGVIWNTNKKNTQTKNIQIYAWKSGVLFPCGRNCFLLLIILDILYCIKNTIENAHRLHWTKTWTFENAVQKWRHLKTKPYRSYCWRRKGKLSRNVVFSLRCDKLKIASTEIHLCAWTVPRDAAKNNYCKSSMSSIHIK